MASRKYFNLATTMAIILMLFWSRTSYSAERTTNAQANKQHIESLVTQATNYIKQNGMDHAVKEFNKAHGQFTKGSSYIFVLDYQGKLLASRSDTKQIGHNLESMKDSKGNFFVRDLINKGKQGGGWVSYMMINPANNERECKSSYVVAVSDNYIVGSGYYHPTNASGECTL
ncbi:MAG: cache domain-containing protein [Candidatus Berkiellales bacterium]